MCSHSAQQHETVAPTCWPHGQAEGREGHEAGPWSPRELTVGPERKQRRVVSPPCYPDPLTLGCLVRYPKINPGSRLSPPQSSRSTQNDHPTCGELAVGPAIMPRTIRPHFGLTFSPTLLVSRGGSDGWSLSIFSHAGATGRLSAGTVCTGLLLCRGLLGDTKLPSASPSRLSCLQKRDSSIKTHIPGRIANNNSKFHIHRELRASPWQPCGDF